MTDNVLTELLEVIEALKIEVAKRNDTPTETETETEAPLIFKIDDNIPVHKPRQKRQAKYPIPDLEVGQSFFLPGENASQLLSSTAGHYTADGQKKFTIRQAKENGVFGARLWRTK